MRGARFLLSRRGPVECLTLAEQEAAHKRAGQDPGAGCVSVVVATRSLT